MEMSLCYIHVNYGQTTERISNRPCHDGVERVKWIVGSDGAVKITPVRNCQSWLIVLAKIPFRGLVFRTHACIAGDLGAIAPFIETLSCLIIKQKIKAQV